MMSFLFGDILVFISYFLFVTSNSHECKINTCNNYDESYFFSYLAEIIPTHDNKVGTVSIGKQLQVTFDMKITGDMADIGVWGTILHVGDDHATRLPGFWLYPSENKLAVRMSDSEGSPSDNYDDTQILTIGNWYKVKVTVCDSVVTSYINNRVIIQKTNKNTLTSRDESIYIGNPSNNAPAPVVIKNIIIQPCIGKEQVLIMCGANTCNNYDDNYFFSYMSQIAPVHDNQVGIVSITDQLQVTFDMEITGDMANINNWGTILHVGDNHATRLPGFWLYPSENKLAVRMSDTEGSPSDNYDDTNILTVGNTYNVKLTVCDGDVRSYINNNIIVHKSNKNTLTKTDQAVWIGNPSSNDPAPVVISNIVIKPCIDNEFESGTTVIESTSIPETVSNRECIANAESICIEFYDEFCDACNNNIDDDYKDSLIENCSYDFCEINYCNENVFDMDLYTAINAQCLHDTYQECLSCI